MSNKTIFKRIALTAVSALAAGTLSVIAIPVASAAPDDDKFYIGTTNAVAAVLSDSDETALRSVGVLASTTTHNATTQTATMLSNGALAVMMGGAADTSNISSIVVTGGTISAFDEESQTANTGSAINASRTALVASAANKNLAATVTPNSGATTVVIEAYNGDNVSSTAPTNGTLRGRVTVTIATTSVAGVLSQADSSVYWATNASPGTASATTNATTANFTQETGGDVYFVVTLLDAYEAAINNAAAFVTASVTGNAKVDLNTASGSTSTALATNVDYQVVASLTGGKIYGKISQATANAPANFTLTVKYNDTTLATKTGVIKGTVTKIDVKTAKIGSTLNSDANTAAFLYTLSDSAGNPVYPSSQTTAITVDSLTLNLAVTAASVATAYSSSVAAGAGGFTCSSATVAGISPNTAKLRLQMLDAASKWVYSNYFDVACGGVARSFTASLDKTTYTPGSVVTLTIDFKDSKGNTVNDYYTVTADTTAGTDGAATSVSYVGAPATVVSGEAHTDLPVNGKLTYTFIAGTTEGDFNVVVDAPFTRGKNLEAGGSQGKITIPYTIKSSSTAVSTNEVLAAIVKLIATINKQIRQLQKQLRR